MRCAAARAGAGERQPGVAALHEARAQGRLDLRHRLRHRGLAQVRRACRRAHTAAPDHLIEQHQVAQVRRRSGTLDSTAHVHNFLYPAVNCNYPRPGARPDNGRVIRCR